MRESSIEKKFCDKARALGCVVTKFKDSQIDGAPDRIVLIPGGDLLFIEFKRPGQEPTEHQRRYIQNLRAMNFYAVWTDDADDAIRLVIDIMKKPVRR